MNKQLLVEDFMQTFNQKVRETPSKIPTTERKLRESLIVEEYAELLRAMYNEDLVEIADGLADLLYVLYGTAASYGIHIDPVFREVHRSNMTKVGGSYNSQGKLVKPDSYSPPNIQDILITQGANFND